MTARRRRHRRSVPMPAEGRFRRALAALRAATRRGLRFRIRCLLMGHEDSFARQPRRLMLRCATCGRETVGWAIGPGTPAVMAGAPHIASTAGRRWSTQRSGWGRGRSAAAKDAARRGTASGNVWSWPRLGRPSAVPMTSDGASPHASEAGPACSPTNGNPTAGWMWPGASARASAAKGARRYVGARVADEAAGPVRAVAERLLRRLAAAAQRDRAASRSCRAGRSSRRP